MAKSEDCSLIVYIIKISLKIYTGRVALPPRLALFLGSPSFVNKCLSLSTHNK